MRMNGADFGRRTLRSFAERSLFMTTAMSLKIVLSDDGATSDDLDREVMRVRRELLRYDIDSVRVATEPGPDGSRGVDIAQVGALVVMLAPTIKLLGGVFDVVKFWLGTRAQRSVKVEIDGDVLEVTGAVRNDIRKLVDGFVEKHAISEADDGDG
jgi:hypothetical protein